jgi:hypothetical protein
MPAALAASDAIYLGYIVANAALALGFVGWFFFRLEKIVAANGSFDLYLNLVFRLLPWQAALLVAYLVATAFVGKAG